MILGRIPIVNARISVYSHVYKLELYFLRISLDRPTCLQYIHMSGNVWTTASDVSIILLTKYVLAQIYIVC